MQIILNLFFLLHHNSCLEERLQIYNNQRCSQEFFAKTVKRQAKNKLLWYNRHIIDNAELIYLRKVMHNLQINILQNDETLQFEGDLLTCLVAKYFRL